MVAQTQFYVELYGLFKMVNNKTFILIRHKILSRMHEKKLSFILFSSVDVAAVLHFCLVLLR